MPVDYVAVLRRLHPGGEWTLNGDDYSGLVWHSETAKPTKASLDAAWPQVQHEDAVEAIRQARQRRYTVETDPMFMKAQRDEEDGVTMADWKAAVAAIKADLPYPAAP